MKEREYKRYERASGSTPVGERTSAHGEGLVKVAGRTIFVDTEHVKAFEEQYAPEIASGAITAAPEEEPAATEPEPEFLTLDQLEDAGGKLGISEARIRGALGASKIAGANKPGGVWKIPRLAGLAWLQEASDADKAAAEHKGQGQT